MTSASRTRNNGDTWTIPSVREALLAKRISARELAERIPRAHRKAQSRAECVPRAFARARLRASRPARRTHRGREKLPSLAGLPLAVKDVLSTHGVPTTCASRMLEGYRAAVRATAVERLESAGAMVLGKTNCDEFAMGGSNENSAYGPVRNPVALDRVPGGSSGGSAAAVAAGLAVVALGTDTGGSIRQPAAFCGIPGMMPTYGRVSRYGLIAFASSLDRIGPFARNVRDAAAVLAVIAGRDPQDSTSRRSSGAQTTSQDLDEPVKGLRIGVPTDYFGKGLDPEVREQRSKRESRCSNSWAAGACRCACRTPITPWPPTT